jgi:hypothetical protein
MNVSLQFYIINELKKLCVSKVRRTSASHRSSLLMLGKSGINRFCSPQFILLGGESGCCWPQFQCRSVRAQIQLWQDEKYGRSSGRKPVSTLGHNYSLHSSSGESYGRCRTANQTLVHSLWVSKCLVVNLAGPAGRNQTHYLTVSLYDTPANTTTLKRASS